MVPLFLHQNTPNTSKAYNQQMPIPHVQVQKAFVRSKPPISRSPPSPLQQALGDSPGSVMSSCEKGFQWSKAMELIHGVRRVRPSLALRYHPGGGSTDLLRRYLSPPSLLKYSPIIFSDSMWIHTNLFLAIFWRSKEDPGGR